MGFDKKKPEGLERQTLKIVSTLPWLDTATNASAKQRLELLQCDRKPNNAIGSRSRKVNAKAGRTLMNRNADSRHNA